MRPSPEGRLPLLSRDEEAALAGTIREGRESKAMFDEADSIRLDLGPEMRDELERRISAGMAARNELAMRNAGLARTLTRECAGSCHPEFEDMAQEAMIGLMRAAELFDPSRGVRFSAYARWFIRLKVFRALGKATVVRVPRREWKKGARREESISDFADEIPARGSGDNVSPLDAMIAEEEAAGTAASVRAGFDDLTDDEWLTVSWTFGLDSEQSRPFGPRKCKALLDTALPKLRRAYSERVAA